jgi:hypothetical protein
MQYNLLNARRREPKALRFCRPSCICRAHRRQRGRETHVSKAPRACALAARCVARGVRPDAREAGACAWPATRGGLLRVMRCHSACAGQCAAVRVGSGDVAFGVGTAYALGVAAGPGVAQPQGPWREPQRWRRRQRRQRHVHAAAASHGGVSGAAAVAAFAGRRQGRCSLACCRWLQVVEVRSHAAPPWSTATDPLTPCLVRTALPLLAQRAPLRLRACRRARGACCRWLRCVDKTATLKQRQRSTAATDLAWTALPFQRAARSRLHQAAARGERTGPAFVSVARACSAQLPRRLMPFTAAAQASALAAQAAACAADALAATAAPAAHAPAARSCCGCHPRRVLYLQKDAARTLLTGAAHPQVLRHGRGSRCAGGP